MSMSGSGHAEAPISRDRIIEVAAGIVAEDGIEGLSMRRLAKECGVSSMAPYRYISSKEDLLRALANQFLDEIEYPAMGSLGWDGYLREVFVAVRKLMLEHPELAEIAARHRVNGLAAYRGAELTLSALREAGLTKEDAVSAFTALYAFTIGFVLQETAGADRTAQIAERFTAIAELPAQDFPHLRASTVEFLYSNTEQNFRRGLDFIIRGIGAVLDSAETTSDGSAT
jgi:TetR/AcrR family transcriptional regulator, tetracycline repressor protein